MAKQLRREGLGFVDRAPVRIEASIDLAAPPAAVWPAIAEAEQWPAWFGGMKVCRYTTPPPHGVGAGRHVEVKGLVVEEELLAFDADERYAFVVLQANLPAFAALVEVVTLEARDGGTRVTYVQALEVAGWLKPLTPILRRQLTSALRAGLAGLDRWLESNPPPRSG